jgi:hypothetical protein
MRGILEALAAELKIPGLIDVRRGLHRGEFHTIEKRGAKISRTKRGKGSKILGCGRPAWSPRCHLCRERGEYGWAQCSRTTSVACSQHARPRYMPARRSPDREPNHPPSATSNRPPTANTSIFRFHKLGYELSSLRLKLSAFAHPHSSLGKSKLLPINCSRWCCRSWRSGSSCRCAS